MKCLRIQRKKILKLIILLLLAPATVFLFQLNISASDEGRLPEEYKDLVDAVPEEIIESLPEGIFSQEEDEIYQTAQNVSSPTYILSLLAEGFGGRLSEVLPTFAMLIGIVIIVSLINSLSGMAGANKDAVDFAVRLCSFCAVSALTLKSLSRITEYFNSLFTYVAAFVPLSGALYAMGGNLTAAASSTFSLSVTLTVCEFICTKTIIPVFAVCLALTLLNVFDGGGSASSSLSGLIKKHYLTAFSFVALILTSSLGAQSILASKADNVAMKGIKFAISGFVPISGGTVSSTLGTLSASVELIRGSVGVIGIAVMILLLLPTVIELALLRLAFGIASFVAGMLSCHGEQKFLSDIGGLYSFLEGAALLCAVIFIIAMGIFASVCAAV